MSPVLFNQVLNMVPDNAIMIEIAPHCLLQAVLKRSVPTSCVKIGLMKKSENDLEYFLNSIGSLYKTGLNPRLSKLFDYEICALNDTAHLPSLSSIVDWDHSKSWRVPFWNPDEPIESISRFSHFGDFSLMSQGNGSQIHKIDLNNRRWRSIIGHQIDGRNLFPATGSIVLIAELMLRNGNNVFDFHDVTFVNPIIIPAEGCEIKVSILNTSGEFEVSQCSNNVVACHGRVSLSEEKSKPDEIKISEPIIGSLHLKADEIYSILRQRGYEYTKAFQSIDWFYRGSGEKHDPPRCGIKFPTYDDQLTLSDSWTAFLDCMLQFYVLAFDSSDKSLSVPTRITKFHFEHKEMNSTTNEHIAIFDKSTKSIHCAGSYIHDLNVSSINRKHQSDDVVLGDLEFVCLGSNRTESFKAVLNTVLEVAAMRSNRSNLNVCRLILNANEFDRSEFEQKDLTLLKCGRPISDYEILYTATSFSKTDECEATIRNSDIIVIGDEELIAPSAHTLVKNGSIMNSYKRAVSETRSGNARRSMCPESSPEILNELGR